LRRRNGAIIWLVGIAVLVLLVLAWQYVDYRASRVTLPVGMTVAGLPVRGMTREQVMAELTRVYAEPVEVTYQDQPRLLSPDAIELRLDPQQTEANLDAALAAQGGVEGFLAHLLRQDLEPVDVPAAVQYSGERLDGFLAQVAQQYDRLPQDPLPRPETLTFYPGQSGYALDVPASRAVLDTALVSAVDRNVVLVVQEQPPPPVDMALLEQMLREILEGHPGMIPGIFIKDLQNGDELAINADVAYAGLSTLKIAIMVETYRVLDQPPDVEQTKLLSETMTLSGNFTANLLLSQIVGNGDGYQGAENLTASMNHLGLPNTFLAAPYDAETVPPVIVTPANSRTDVTTYPDPYMQTTPLDMGLLMEMIYQCSQGGGTLMVAYPDAFTAEECSQMITWMSANKIGGLIEAGVPLDTQVAHKHGWISDTHGDSAIVFTPGGDFVLIVFLCRPLEWLVWEEANPLMAQVAQATYNYFNPSQ